MSDDTGGEVESSASHRRPQDEGSTASSENLKSSDSEAEEHPNCAASDTASDVSTDDDGQQASESGGELGAFFAPSKRKTRLKGSKKSANAPVPSPSQLQGSSDAASSSSPGLSRSLGSRKVLSDFETGDLGGGDAMEPRSARHAASRAAWKRRGAEGAGGVSSSSQDGAQPDAGTAPKAPNKSHRMATGMYRVSRAAADSAGCHWLISPDSLLTRLDPVSGRFLARMWLSSANLSSERDRVRPDGKGGVRRSYPARLHAGWLAQMLRPKGWLASIPEDEVRNLPMPEDLISEPDRGPRRPNTAVLQKVILRELTGAGS
eukprot:TRINITY_DN108907_c0_g1_i1.p1 TRINITY_DN108907_c0_g1~~TRINITY_DN108907_c0_g1_i1.p1  ORF type:complete len:319 (-),score=37.02 TRINITY_DN108907_c0_g1_i1:77-1033(-)